MRGKVIRRMALTLPGSRLNSRFVDPTGDQVLMQARKGKMPCFNRLKTEAEHQKLRHRILLWNTALPEIPASKFEA
jgi:hypothetical protein